MIVSEGTDNSIIFFTILIIYYLLILLCVYAQWGWGRLAVARVRRSVHTLVG